MSQRRAFVDGKYVWISEGEAFAGSIRFGGSIDFAQSGSVEQSRIAERRNKAAIKAAKAAQG